MIDFDEDGFAFVAPDDPAYDEYVAQREASGGPIMKYSGWLRIFKRQPSSGYLQAKEAARAERMGKRTDEILKRFDAAVSGSVPPDH